MLTCGWQGGGWLAGLAGLGWLGWLGWLGLSWLGYDGLAGLAGGRLAGLGVLGWLGWLAGLAAGLGTHSKNFSIFYSRSDVKRCCEFVLATYSSNNIVANLSWELILGTVLQI